MADFTIKQYDTLPPLVAVLRVGGSVIGDLADAAVIKLVMAKRDNPEVFVFAKDAVIVDVAAGKVGYNWVSGDTDDADEYLACWHILYNDGTSRTVPTVGKFSVSIESALPIWFPDRVGADSAAVADAILVESL